MYQETSGKDGVFKPLKSIMENFMEIDDDDDDDDDE